MKKINYLILLLTVLFAGVINAQSYTVSGTIKDAESGEKLVGANVYIEALNIGAVSNTNGVFEITSVSGGTFEITASFIGYSKMTKNLKVTENVEVNFDLSPSSVLLTETVVKSTRAVLRETPVAFTEVLGKDLEFKLSSRDVPQELESVVPSLYSSVGGGGSGDATMYVRGFSQRNIAIMINGVPVNDMENKWVYWSNWAGIGDVTESIQSQRGLGVSPYSVNAIGGVINVRTSSVASQEVYTRVKSEYGSENLIKGSVAFHQKLSNNLSVTGLISKKNWDGYADGTYHKEWTYYFSVGGVFGNHSLEVTGVGSPQEHGQRPFYAKRTIADWAKYGKEYNYAQGRLNGGFILETVNKYHKPAFNLNWNWQLSDKSTLSTIVYYSTGTGWGSGTLGSFAKRTADGYGDYDAIYTANSQRINSTYSNTETQSTTIFRNSVNNHYWTGLLSTYTTKLTDALTLNAGIDGRYYIGEHYREVTNLLGGDYYLERNDISRGAYMAGVDDKVGYYNDMHVRQLGGFGQVEYKTGAITTYINVSAFAYGAQRIDYFLYAPDNEESDWQNFTGYTAKAGINYNLNDENNVYFNAGYFSTPPIVDNIFSNNTNVVIPNIENEKVLGLELGYGYTTDNLNVRLNGFYTQWSDRAFSSDVTGSDGVRYYANVLGAKQVHIGGELELSYKLFRNLSVNGIASIIDAKFKNDVTSVIAPEDEPTKTKTIVSYVDGLYVSDNRGNFPMQQFSFNVNYRVNLLSGLSANITPVVKYYGENYAYFNPDSRTNSNDRTQSWQYPNYTLFDLHIGFDWLLNDSYMKKISFGVHVFNLADNTDYIVEAQDGSKHDEATSTVFYGRGRWVNFNVAFNF